jgi:hypothetical protein
MAQNITDFYTKVQTHDFARQFQFRLNQLADTNFGETGNNPYLIYVETATLPGRAINNIQVPFMGLNFNVPGTASYPGSDAWSVTFRCDQNYNILTKLEDVQRNVFNEQTSTGNYNIARSPNNIKLELLGKGGSEDVLRTYTLWGAYVVSIGDLSYNIGDNGTIQTVPVTLAYQYWTAANKA